MTSLIMVYGSLNYKLISISACLSPPNNLGRKIPPANRFDRFWVCWCTLCGVEQLNQLGIRTSRGGEWSLMQLQRVMAITS